jgi:hypothetical protein
LVITCRLIKGERWLLESDSYSTRADNFFLLAEMIGRIELRSLSKSSSLLARVDRFLLLAEVIG